MYEVLSILAPTSAHRRRELWQLHLGVRRRRILLLWSRRIWNWSGTHRIYFRRIPLLVKSLVFDDDGVLWTLILIKHATQVNSMVVAFFPNHGATLIVDHDVLVLNVAVLLARHSDLVLGFPARVHLFVGLQPRRPLSLPAMKSRNVANNGQVLAPLGLCFLQSEAYVKPSP